MGKTHHHNDRNAGGGRHDPTTTNPQTRATLISKSLSRLLRHAAEQERMPIDPHGWVRVDHILAWRGLAKFQPRVNFEEVVQGVREDGKGRFGLRFIGRQTGAVAGMEGSESHQDCEENRVGECPPQIATKRETEPEPDTESESESETARALRTFDSSQDQDPKTYMIRANQGHSMKGVSEEGLLTPLTLPEKGDAMTTSGTRSDLPPPPKTVVHGTFYGAYEAILVEGALRAMTRNHVHFSSGPDAEVARGVGHNTSVEVEPTADSATNGTRRGHTDAKGTLSGQQPLPASNKKKNQSKLAQMMAQAKVKSGMRPDAEILIYVDVEKALTRGMKWWRSENGVLLSEGLSLVSRPSSDVVGEVVDSVSAGDHAEVEVEAGEKVKGKGKPKGKEKEQGGKEEVKGISTEFWLEVVEVKEGLGTLWKDGSVVKELPERLRGRSVPMGKGRRGGRGGGGAGRGRIGSGRERGGSNRPRLNIGRGDVDVDVDVDVIDNDDSGYGAGGRGGAGVSGEH